MKMSTSGASALEKGQHGNDEDSMSSQDRNLTDQIEATISEDWECFLPKEVDLTESSSEMKRCLVWLFLNMSVAICILILPGELSGRVPRTPSNFPLSARQKQQVESYKKGTGLLVNIVIPHQGGAKVCQRIGRLGPSPATACRVQQSTNSQLNGTPWDNRGGVPVAYPWTREETHENLLTTRKQYHMVAWELSITKLHDRPLHETKWDDLNLVSILVMRDPISRLLASDKEATTGMNISYPLEDIRAKEQNYLLRLLSGPGCCYGDSGDGACYRQAQALIEQFTFVLDNACLERGLVVLGGLLGLPMEHSNTIEKNDQTHHRRPQLHSARDRIGNEDIYNYLVERNRLSIDLYEWSKRRSLVDCSALGPE